MRKITPRFFHSILAVSLLFLGIQQGFAQLDAQLSLNDAFAKGNFIEIGINENGTFGVPNDQNPGPPYHDSRETVNDLFGFIANPVMDGWVDYDGDFFTPGTPEEGFGLEYDGTVRNNNLAFPNDIPGAVSGAGILTDPCFGDFAQISWNGFIDGIEIIRNFSISRDGLFIRMEQRLTNFDDVPKTNVYWMNNVDPDNNQTINTSFVTNQELIAQPSGGLDILGFVCASQGPLGGVDTNGSSVCYYVQDERARVTYGGFSNRDPSDIWNGIGFTQTEGSSNTGDEAISIAYFFGDLAPGESVNFTYFYVFRDFTGGGVDPTFITLTPQSPSDCGLDDGSILVTGLLGDVDYNISYVDDGVPVGPIVLTADMSGSLTIGGLDAGTYTDFIFTNDAGCLFENDGPIVIEDPGAPGFGVVVNQPVICDNDGSIELTGLTPATTYDLTYTQDGVVVGPTAVIADATGSIFITGLGEVTITDITVADGPCVSTDPGPYDLVYPVFTPVVTTADPVNCDSDGSLIVDGMAAATTYEVTYLLDGVLVGPITVTTDASGQFIIPDLDEGVYTDITIVLNECSYVAPGPFELFRPSLGGATITGVDPITCGPTGQVIIMNVFPNTTFELTYTFNGTPVGPISVTSDADGTIIITGLLAGVYDAGILTFNDCSFTQPEPLTLVNPASPSFTVTAIDSDVCGPNGALLIEGLDPETTYDVTYTVNGLIVGPAAFTSDTDGTILIGSLDEGTYTDITLDLAECVTVDPGPYDINYPADPSFTVTVNDPTTCSADGSIVISGLSAATTYDVTYTFDGTVVGPAAFTSDATGSIVLSGLDQGTYTDIIVDLGACVASDPGPYVITYPAGPTFSVTVVDPSTCSADGSLIITGLDASTAYNVSYTFDGTVVGPDALTSDGSGNITISGLDQGMYTDITVEVGGCVTVDPGPYVITYPDGPVFTVTVNDPATCSADGSLVITGLDASTTYNVSYTFDGTVVGPDALSSDSTGTIIISGLDQGSYTDITVEVGGCVTVDPGPYVISYPDSPAINDPAPYSLCGATADEAAFDLTSRDAEIVGSASVLDVSYHETAEDADSGDNPLVSPYTNTSNPQTIFVRVVDSVTGCFSTTTLELVVLSLDSLTPPIAVESCPSDSATGLTNQFDLTAFNSELGIDLTDLNVTYHNTSADAEDGSNPIANPENYTNSTNPETIYIRVFSNLGCLQTTQVEISVVACDIEIPEGISPNSDGFNDSFSIAGLELHPNFQLKIFDRRGLLIYSGNSSAQEWDGRAIEKNGELLPVGTYFYTLQLNDQPGNPFSDVEQLYSGWVYLNY